MGPHSSFLPSEPRPFSFIPFCPQSPLRPVAGRLFWACCRRSGPRTPPGPAPRACSVGSEPGALAWQRVGALTPFFLRYAALGFPQRRVSPGSPHPGGSLLPALKPVSKLTRCTVSNGTGNNCAASFPTVRMMSLLKPLLSCLSTPRAPSARPLVTTAHHPLPPQGHQVPNQTLPFLPSPLFLSDPPQWLLPLSQQGLTEHLLRARHCSRVCDTT